MIAFAILVASLFLGFVAYRISETWLELRRQELKFREAEFGSMVAAANDPGDDARDAVIYRSIMTDVAVDLEELAADVRAQFEGLTGGWRSRAERVHERLILARDKLAADNL